MSRWTREAVAELVDHTLLKPEATDVDQHHGLADLCRVEDGAHPIGVPVHVRSLGRGIGLPEAGQVQCKRLHARVGQLGQHRIPAR